MDIKKLPRGLFNNYVTLASSHRDRPISMVVLHVFRDSERDAGSGWFKNSIFSVTQLMNGP